MDATLATWQDVKRYLLVELALAERDSKNAGIFFPSVFPNWSAMVPVVPSGDRENWE